MSEVCPQVVWQESLFADSDAAREGLSFESLRRDDLDERSWIDVVPGWLSDHGDLFEHLLEHAPWQQRTRQMWDNEVLEPRLTARIPEPFPDRILELVTPLNERYRVELDSCLVNLYRDGSDAVAWHADTVRKVMTNPLVATISWRRAPQEPGCR